MKLSVAFLYLGIGLVLAKKDEGEKDQKDKNDKKIGGSSGSSGSSSGVVEETTITKNTPTTFEDVLLRKCSSDDPCEQGEGVCISDDQCRGDLICYSNTDGVVESRAAPPGCLVADFCWTPPDPFEKNLADFTEGMAFELSGTWVGAEMWKDDDGTLYDYCSRVLFRGDSDSRNFLSWTSNYNGEVGEYTCKDWDVDPKSTDEKDWWYDRDADNLLLGDGYKQCLPAADCTYDVTKDKSEEFKDFTVVAKSCGRILLEDMLSGQYDCEVYQVTRLFGEVNKTDTNIDVVTLTYGSKYTGSFGNFTCPSKPTFDQDELKNDSNAKGTTRFVLQVGAGNSVPNQSDWECGI